MPAHDGFQVHIISECRTLIEYGVALSHKSGSAVLTCHIASVSGKEFEVNWFEPAMKTDMIVKVSMDGQLTDEVANFEYDGAGESKGVIDFGLKTFRPYRFENIKTTDDERLAHRGRVSTRLGTITVQLFKIERWDECKIRRRFDSKSVVNPRHVHAADKMGDQHTVGFGARREMRGHPYCYQVYKPVGEEKKPFLTFIFKYMPHAVLERLGIAPPRVRETAARKRPPSRSLIANAYKRSRDNAESSAEGDDSGDETRSSSPSSGSEGSGTSPEPESEEGVSEAGPAIGKAPVEDGTGGGAIECQQRSLIACRASELATIEAQIAKLQEELARKQAALMEVIIRQV